MSRFTRWIASNGTRALALALVVGFGGVAALTPTQAEARESRGGWDSRSDGGRNDNRRQDHGRYDRDRDHDRGWQRRHSRYYEPRTYYAPRYYRYTPPRPWTWYQTWPTYYDY